MQAPGLLLGDLLGGVAGISTGDATSIRRIFPLG
jgi:hypothetical protein